MIIPDAAVIPVEKLTRYPLVERPSDDKSRFLAQAGYTLGNPDDLMAAIRRPAIGAIGVEDRNNEYGVFYQVHGGLVGVNGRVLPVITVWIRWHLDDSVHFVTLKPWKVVQR